MEDNKSISKSESLRRKISPLHEAIREMQDSIEGFLRNPPTDDAGLESAFSGIMRNIHKSKIELNKIEDFALEFVDTTNIVGE